MVSLLHSPPCSPRFSKPVTRHLSPNPPTLQCRRVAASSAACATSPERTRSPTNSLYGVLGIQVGASNDEIKAAYRSLARVCHPDVADPDTGAGNEFIKVYAAYSTLSDPDKRADYDRGLCRRRPRIRDDTSSFRAYPAPRRNWETDQCW